MKTTRYFTEQVIRKRSYLQIEWCRKALQNPLKKEIQPDNRIKHWIFIKKHQKYLRVITLQDGKTIHNAFFDRNFTP